MAVLRRIQLEQRGEVTLVRFMDRRIIDARDIQELGDELFHLIEVENRKRLLLDFASVVFLSSAALNKLIILDKKVKSRVGKLVLTGVVHQDVSEPLRLTRLDQLFNIQPDVDTALAAFAAPAECS